MKRVFYILPLLAIEALDCTPAKEYTADATYGGQQLSCVDRNSTRATIDACRAEVDKRWCVVDGAATCVPEGGISEGGALTSDAGKD